MPNLWCFQSKKELLNIAGNVLVSSQLFFHCHQCENHKISNIYFCLLDGLTIKCCYALELLPGVQSTSVSFAKGFSNGSSSELVLVHNLKCEVRSMGYKIQ